MLDRCTLKQFVSNDFTFMDLLPWSSSYQQSGPENTLVAFASNVTRITLSLTRTLATPPRVVYMSCFDHNVNLFPHVMEKSIVSSTDLQFLSLAY